MKIGKKNKPCGCIKPNCHNRKLEQSQNGSVQLNHMQILNTENLEVFPTGSSLDHICLSLPKHFAVFLTKATREIRAETGSRFSAHAPKAGSLHLNHRWQPWNTLFLKTSNDGYSAGSLGKILGLCYPDS